MALGRCVFIFASNPCMRGKICSHVLVMMATVCFLMPGSHTVLLTHCFTTHTVLLHIFMPGSHTVLSWPAHTLSEVFGAEFEEGREVLCEVCEEPLLVLCVDFHPPGKGNSNSDGARPVHQIITMIKWIRTSRLSIKNYLSLWESAKNLSSSFA